MLRLNAKVMNKGKFEGGWFKFINTYMLMKRDAVEFILTANEPTYLPFILLFKNEDDRLIFLKHHEFKYLSNDI